MSKKLTKHKLEKHLAHLTKKELISEIGKLFARFAEVKQFYQMEYGEKEDRNKILKEYKKKIKDQFYSSRSGYPKDPKASELRKIISTFKKVAVFPHEIVDLILYRVECAVEYTNDFGDIDERFYESTENAFWDALKIIGKEKLHQMFQVRCQGIVEDTNGIGWGFHDTLGEYYYDCYGNFTEDN